MFHFDVQSMHLAVKRFGPKPSSELSKPVRVAEEGTNDDEESLENIAVVMVKGLGISLMEGSTGSDKMFFLSILSTKLPSFINDNIPVAFG